MFEGIVIILTLVLDRNRCAQISQFDHDLWIVVTYFDWSNVFNNGLDLVQDVRNQESMVRCEKPPRLLNDRGMRNVFIVAHLFDGIDYVVGKLLSRIVC